jgi:hypothetical protein
MTEHVPRLAPYERGEGRAQHRNGHKPRGRCTPELAP